MVNQLSLPCHCPSLFTIADGCSADGHYGNALATLWLAGPDGVEQPARPAEGGDGNRFTYDTITSWYRLTADVSNLAAGSWSATARLDDGNEYSSTFIIP